MALTYQAAVEQTITAGEQIHQIVNGTATTEVTVEDGSKVPSIRKALLDNFYFKDPIAWQVGQTENVFNQLRQFTDGSWWYAPSATASNPISMGSTPVGDPLWKIYDFDAIGKLTPQIREALRRSYAEAGYNLVDGSFEAGGTLVNANDVLLQERTGKAFSGPAGTVAAVTNPASGGFVDKSGGLLRHELATSASAIGNANGGSVQDFIDKYVNFESVSEALAYNKHALGNKYIVSDYYGGLSPNGSGVLFFKVVAAGSGVSDGGKYIDIDGGLYQLEQNLRTTVLATSYGVRGSESYNDPIAYNNRLQSVRMLAYTGANIFEFDIVGNAFFVGSVNCNRSNITVKIPSGANLKAKYNSTAHPASTVAQVGHFFGFVGYTDPERGDFNITITPENVKVILDGDVETIYDPSHEATHNNTPIAFFRADGCEVVGSGGISGSDHRGINFDGECKNPKIDVGYINECYNNPVSVKGVPSDKTVANVRVREIVKSQFGSTNAVCLCFDYAICNVEVESYTDSSGSVADHLIRSTNIDNMNVFIGRQVNAATIVRFSDTKNISVSGANAGGAFVDSVDLIQRSSEVVTVPLQTVVVNRVQGGASLKSILKTETATGKFSLLSIRNCDLLSCSSAFKYYDGITSNNLPRIFDIANNISPSLYTPLPNYKNIVDTPTGNLVVGTPTSVTINVYSPDNSYRNLSLRISDGGVLYSVTIYIDLIGNNGKIALGASEFTFITSSFPSITINRTSGSGVFVNAIMHN